MEAPRSEVSHKANSSLLGIAELPPKKRTVDRASLQPASNSEPTSNTLGIEERAQKNGSPDKGKTSLDQEPSKLDHTPEITPQKDEPNPSVSLHSTEGGKGDSSKPRPNPPRKPIVCKFCGQQFSTTQALGGHQNAHKEEREMEKAMKAAYEFGGSSFFYHYPGTSTPAFHGSYYEHPFQSPFYHRFAHRGWQPRPSYPSPTLGLGLGSPGLARTLEGLIGPSARKPIDITHNMGWARPYPYVHASGPIKRPRESTNFDSLPGSNLTNFLQKMQNKDGSGKKQCTESTGLNLSPKCTESENLGSLSKLNESAKEPTKNKSTELDLTLKL